MIVVSACEALPMPEELPSADEVLARLVAGSERFIRGEARFPLQYAGVHLRTPLFLVLGHESCGAVQAALAAHFRGARDRKHIAVLLKDILPGLRDVRAELAPHRQLDAAVEANVRWSMRQLLDMPEVKARETEGVMKLVGAVFEMTTGRVRLLPDSDGGGVAGARQRNA
jgi:carbonic anhydrase